MWTPVTPNTESDSAAEALVSSTPSARSKHASVLHGQNLYLLGGRNGNVPLKDFWRYNIAENSWNRLQPKGDGPSCLQEHTMVAYKDTLYVFGGEVGFSNGVETPLWMYDVKSNSWRKFHSPKGVVTPKGRRSHTATVFQDSLYIYGGYQDLKGSSSELWAFHFESETWHLVSQGGAVDGPPPRHRHSAVLHDSAMWVFGGMTDLQERSDFWRFDFVSRRWRPVKSRPGPGCLHSHCAVKFLSVMMLFGGEREGQCTNEMWRFHFATEFWERLSFVNSQPMPRAQTTAFIFSKFTTRGTVHYMGLPEQDYYGCQPEPSTGVMMNKGRGPPLREKLNQFQSPIPLRRGQNGNHSVSSSNATAKKYMFKNAPDSCVDEDQSSTTSMFSQCVEQIPREFLRDLRRPSHFQRLPTGAGNASSSTSSGTHSTARDSLSLRDQLARISRLGSVGNSGNSHRGSCAYSMFSNESTESLNTENSSAAASPCSVRMMCRSRSSQQLLNLNLREAEPASSASGVTVTPSDDLGTPKEAANGSSITRDPVSVPNFSQLQKTRSMDESIPQEMIPMKSKLMEEVAEEEASAPSSSSSAFNSSGSGSDEEASSAKSTYKTNTLGRSDSAYTFQSYDCSSRSSTLSSNTPAPSSKSGGGGPQTSHQGLEMTAMGSTASKMSKSTSSALRGVGDIRLVDVDEEDLTYLSTDEFSSLSGYESCEAIETIEKSQARAECDSRMSFSNPHYLGPDVQALLTEKHRRRRQQQSVSMKQSDSHQSFAAALNSPADSLFSDYQDFHTRLHQDFVQLNDLPGQLSKPSNPNPRARPKSAVVSQGGGALIPPSKATALVPSPPDPCNGQLRPPGAGSSQDAARKARPVSAEIHRDNRVTPLLQQQQQSQLEDANGDHGNQLLLLMYILGGREVGQVTVFRRPISMWRLDLTKTF